MSRPFTNWKGKLKVFTGPPISSKPANPPVAAGPDALAIALAPALIDMGKISTAWNHGDMPGVLKRVQEKQDNTNEMITMFFWIVGIGVVAWLVKSRLKKNAGLAGVNLSGFTGWPADADLDGYDNSEEIIRGAMKRRY